MTRFVFLWNCAFSLQKQLSRKLTSCHTRFIASFCVWKHSKEMFSHLFDDKIKMECSLFIIFAITEYALILWYKKNKHAMKINVETTRNQLRSLRILEMSTTLDNWMVVIFPPAFLTFATVFWYLQIWRESLHVEVFMYLLVLVANCPVST